MITLKGTTLNVWNAFLSRQSKGTGCEDRISYTRYGNTGYLNACSFDAKAKGKYSLDSIKYKIDRIFKQISQDGVQKLVIDVSQNEGGNSSVGDYLISFFYDRPYKDYQCNWKKSEEYYKLLKSWGFDKPDYTAAANGQVLHYPSETVTPAKVPYLFKGKVMVVIGAATFSSAMNFATVIRDNHMATLIGQTPVNGHPNGFGEMYYTNLPNTKVFVRFGVKEWIRPAGKTGENILRPDIILTQAQLSSVKEMIKKTE
ncbi:MAG: hypothetical protein EOO61_19255 [Hymenobacter sp.]|nr:MAG: hypothetical protein EOO61_19255 [Hymenobacter sp.]